MHIFLCSRKFHQVAWTKMKMLMGVWWSRALSAAGVFLAWTLTSFLCHQCSKWFLEVSESMFVSANYSYATGGLSYYRLFIAVAITAVQCFMCILLLHTGGKSGWSKVMTIFIASHVLATLATNYSMTFIEAAFTLAIKLMEPITMAVAHHMVYLTMVPFQTAISLPLIVYGTVIFAGVNTSNVSDTAGNGLALASNIILAARNIAMKNMQHESSSKISINLKPVSHLAATICLQALFVAGMYFLETQGLAPKDSSNLVAFAITSGIFHVAYSYISIVIVLKVMNVVSHSIANIFKRLLVVLMLSALGTRHVSASNFLGLGLAVVGLMVYTYGKITANQQPFGNVEEVTKEISKWHKTRLTVLFLAVLSVVCVNSFGVPVWINTALTSARHLPCKQETLKTHSLFEETGIHDNFSHVIDAEVDPVMREFLSWRLVDHPEDTDKRSKTLTTNREVIEEAQRILVNLMQDLIGNAKHVMLIEIEAFENKGDPAIAAGEVLLLQALKKTIVFHCDSSVCKQRRILQRAKEVNKQYPMGDLHILMQGGGNLVGYPKVDSIRRTFLDAFPERQFILFSQSIWLHGNYTTTLGFARETYSNRPNLVMLLRDRQSLEIAKANFEGVKVILAPDLAFCIGMKPRQMPPLYDIIWLQRDDDEKIHYDFPQIPEDITVNVGDWRRWQTNIGNRTLENVFLFAAEGLQFLQRGRVVVTERLHGHILCILLDIPHVLLDNPPYLKLSSFDRTWTQSLHNTMLVSNGSQVLNAALKLIKRYNNSLPSLSYRDMSVVT